MFILDLDDTIDNGVGVETELEDEDGEDDERTLPTLNIPRLGFELLDKMSRLSKRFFNCKALKLLVFLWPSGLFWQILA